MLFDESFVVSAADLFPNVQCTFAPEHSRVRGDEIRRNSEVHQTREVLHPPYRRNEHASYLADTSLKLMQYDFLGLPAVCPTFAAGDRPHRFSYEPGDAESISQAIQAAMRQGRHKPGHFHSWGDITKRLMNPDAYLDTPLLTANASAAARSRAVA